MQAMIDLALPNRGHCLTCRWWGWRSAGVRAFLKSASGSSSMILFDVCSTYSPSVDSQPGSQYKKGSTHSLIDIHLFPRRKWKRIRHSTAPLPREHYSNNPTYYLGEKVQLEWRNNFTFSTLVLWQDNQPGDLQGGPSAKVFSKYLLPSW